MTTTEDDDDEGFGDFTFAPITVCPNPKINGSDHQDHDVDDWGDFVISTTLSRCESLPAKSLDPVKLFSDHRIDKLQNDVSEPDSAPSRIRTQWVKPTGALPLSLFGEEENEEEKEEVSVAAGLLFNGATELKVNKEVTKEKKMDSELDVSDLISNFYKQSKGVNVSKMDSNGSGLSLENLGSRGGNLHSSGLDLKRSVSNLDSDGLHLKTNLVSNGLGFKVESLGSYGLDLKRSVSNMDSIGLNWTPNLDSKGSGLTLENLEPNGLNLDSKGLDFVRSVSNLGSSGLTSKTKLDSNGLNSDLDEDDDGWEFKVAESELPAGDLNFKSKDEVKAENAPIPNVFRLDPNWHGLGSDINGLRSSFNGVNKDANTFSSSLVDKSEDFEDDDEWEFKDAEPEPLSGDSNSKVDIKVLENADGVKQTFVLDNGAQVPTDLFGVSDGVSKKSVEWDFGFDFSKSSATADGISNSFSNSKKQKDANENEIGLNSTSVNGTVENGENIWAFKDAFSETGSKDAFSEAGSKDKETEAKLENHRVALPLSIFGDTELETDDKSAHQDVSIFNLASSGTDNIKKNQGSNISINDLISSLYSQAEQNTSVDHAQNPSENGFGSTQKVNDSNLDGDGDFDDDSWEFKGAVSEIEDEDQISVPGLGHLNLEYATKVEQKELVNQKDCADFYSKLEDELWIVAQCHYDNLKKARSTAALCGEDDKLEALDKEIQDLFNELHQDGIVSKAYSENLPLSKICLNEYVEVLHEPKFHVLESEYHLSTRLLLAQKNWRSAIELLEHVASMSKILKLGSEEEQSFYVSSWFKMVSVCAQELRHGALIWKQSLEKNVSSQILSDTRGKLYILALGEIYRALEVLGSSVKLYKPWVLLSSADPTGMFTLLSECATLWSGSGLEEAFRSISDLTGFEYNVTPKELLESIKYIHDLDAHALQNHVFSRQEPTCQLTLLAAGIVPGMKMVVWNGEHYFLPLANLWANLVTIDPPNLPHLHAG